MADNDHEADPSRVNLRSYLAGGAASTVLVAAAVIAFLTIAALVAFNGLPFGGGGDSDTVEIAGLPAGAPEAAAASAALAPGAVAATPAAATPVALAGAGSAPGGEGATPGPPGAPLPPGGGDPPGVPPAPPPGSPGASGVLGGAVEGLEQTTAGLGLDLPLSETTKDITGPLDQVLEGALNDVGGGLGKPKLGTEVGSNANDATRELLP